MAYYSIVKLRLAFVMRKLLREQKQRIAFIFTIKLPIRVDPKLPVFVNLCSHAVPYSVITIVKFWGLIYSFSPIKIVIADVVHDDVFYFIFEEVRRKANRA